MRPTVELTKITPPQANKPLHRERLYRLLDEHRHNPATWISAPAGYGKTTLISTYIKERNLPCLWYGMDASDNDLASFFYHLGLATKKASGSNKAMPVLTPEYQLGINSFARIFFREMFRRLPDNTLLVFDDYHHIDATSGLDEIIPDLVNESPPNKHICFISRKTYPTELANLLVKDKLFCLESGTLEFTLEELTHYSATQKTGHKLDASTLSRIHSYAKGWITGIKLLLKSTQDIDHIDRHIEPGDQDAVFGFFTGEVLKNISPDIKVFMLKTAILPSITATLARKITGQSNAKKILDDLVRQQLFIVKHKKFNSTYEYHPLFREFLIDKLEETLEPHEIINLYDSSAIALLNNGNHEYAIDMLICSNNQAILKETLLKIAKELLKQGRNKQLGQWLALLDGEHDTDPWVQYWKGQALLHYDNTVARSHYANAYHAFKQCSDANGLYKSWCGVADTYNSQHDNFTDAVPWIAELDWLQENFPKVPGLESRAMLAFSAAMLLTWTEPTHPSLEGWIKKIETMYRLIPSKALKIFSISQLALYYAQRGQVHKIRRIYPLLKKYSQDKNLPGTYNVFVGVSHVFCDVATAELKLTNGDIDKLIRRNQEAGLSFFSGFVIPTALYNIESRNEVAYAKQLLDSFLNDVHPDRDLEYAHYLYHAGFIHFLRNDITRATDYAQQALSLAENAHAPYPETICRLLVAYLYCETAEYELAIQELDRCDDFCDSINSHFLKISSLFTRCWIAHTQNDIAQMKLLLDRAFSLGEETGLRAGVSWNHKIVNQLCELALIHNIKTDYAHSLIHLYNYHPTVNSDANDIWPYPIRIHTLNKFTVHKDGIELKLSDKHQQFIQSIIALGGKDIHESRLTDALWPDAEGDAAHQSFATTLHRIRKILGKDALLLQHNQVSLNPQICWLDSWSVEQTLYDINNGTLNSIGNAISLFDRLRKHYNGQSFLKSHGNTKIAHFHDMFNQKILAAIQKLGDALFKLEDYVNSIDCLQLGLGINKQSEQLYRSLMECHIAMGNHAEAGLVYQQAKQTIEDELGLSLSSKTQELYQAIQAK